MRFLQSWAMLALFVFAGVAFYALSPRRVRFIDFDAVMASRGIDRDEYTSGPSLAEFIQSMGGDAKDSIEADHDPELIPCFVK
jgi:hypothetical protein